jgi:hypothetical protein
LGSLKIRKTAFYPRAEKKSIDRRSMKSVPAPPHDPIPGVAQRFQVVFAKAVPHHGISN